MNKDSLPVEGYRLEDGNRWIIQDIVQKIDQFEEILILGHINPDWDCIGSQQSLGRYLRKLHPNKKIYTPFPEENFFGSDYPDLIKEEKKFLDLVNSDVSAVDLTKVLLIIVDVGVAERLIFPDIKPAETIVIDHHEINKKNINGDINWIDPERGAASEMIAELLFYYEDNRKFQKKESLFDDRTALFLVNGNWTDTLGFIVDAVTIKTYQILSRLWSYKPYFSQFMREFYSIASFKSIKYRSFLYKNFKIEDGVSYLIYKANPAKIERSKDIGGLINSILSIEGVSASLIATQVEENGPVVIQFRSLDVSGKKQFDVAKFAAKFGGGGHLHASGVTVQTLEEAVKILEEFKKENRNR